MESLQLVLDILRVEFDFINRQNTVLSHAHHLSSIDSSMRLGTGFPEGTFKIPLRKVNALMKERFARKQKMVNLLPSSFVGIFHTMLVLQFHKKTQRNAKVMRFIFINRAIDSCFLRMIRLV